jgi:hypothetical protein
MPVYLAMESALMADNGDELKYVQRQYQDLLARLVKVEVEIIALFKSVDRHEQTLLRHERIDSQNRQQVPSLLIAGMALIAAIIFGLLQYFGAKAP